MFGSKLTPPLCCWLLWLLSACSYHTPAPRLATPPDLPRSISSTPFLRLETAMHTAAIKRIAVDARQRYLVTASHDKTARVWDLSSGELLQILRPPIGEGVEGKLYAVALSPDGSEVALGGYTAGGGSSDVHIYLFDRVSARLIRHIPALPSAIDHLAYSRDGRYLAAALGGANGVRVYDTKDLREVARDSAYGDASYGLDFDARGRLVSSSYDGYIRLYDPQFRLLHKQPAPGGKQPYGVRFAPDGQKIAVGFGDSTAVNVLATDDLRLLYAPNTHGADNGNLGNVVWSQDGQTLYAGGGYQVSGKCPLLAWSQAGRGADSRIALTPNTVMDIQPLRDQRLVYGASDPAWGILAEDGHKLLEKTAQIIDHRASSPDKLRLNRNASALSFARDDAAGRQTLRFDLNRQAYETSDAVAALFPAQTSAAGLSITDWENKPIPKLDQQPLALRPYETSRSLAIDADAQHFLLGTEWSLRYYDRQGRQQWRTTTPGVAWAVNLSRDGRYAVAAFNDGTIRWYRTRDGAEQLAFYPHPDGQRWVLWTPEGFYSASADAEQLIGYQLNQGDDKEGQWVEVKQLAKLFYRPDLIAQRLHGDEQGIQTALRDIGDVRRVLTNGLPPRLALLSPAASRQSSADYTVQFSADDQGGGIGRIVYKVNGAVFEGRPVDIGVPGHNPLSRRFTLQEGDNSIEVTAYDGKNQVESRAITSVVHVEQPKLPVTLHVLALGISTYRDHALQLKYADQDAVAVAEELRRRGNGLFSAVRIHPPLLNQDATLANIDAAFEQLAKQVQPQDVFVLYLAGHGITQNGEYHFVPWETVVKNADSLRDNSLDQNRLTRLLSKIVAGKTLILLDTCDAGSFRLAARDSGQKTRDIEQKTAITRLMRATGRAVIAATSDGHMALEGYQGHGAFTYAVLAGLKQTEDSNGNGQIEVGELANYVNDQVPKITKARWGYEQFPMIDLQGSFAIGLRP